VIDLGELELLEGLAETGPGPHEILPAWTNSSLRAVPSGRSPTEAMVTQRPIVRRG
jgi:hypothetical protein